MVDIPDRGTPVFPIADRDRELLIDKRVCSLVSGRPMPATPAME